MGYKDLRIEALEEKLVALGGTITPDESPSSSEYNKSLKLYQVDAPDLIWQDSINEVEEEVE